LHAAFICAAKLGHLSKGFFILTWQAPYEKIIFFFCISIISTIDYTLAQISPLPKKATRVASPGVLPVHALWS